jgi:AcrR family transcriptional regulator
MQGADRPEPAVRTSIAERLWDASRIEFSQRGYHGARVQGIAHRAGCNVALLYRHWSSKKALYLDVLRAVWRSISDEAAALLETERGAQGVVSAYLDANLRDPIGAQIIIREFLDGGPFLSVLLEGDPNLVEPIRRTARALGASNGSGGQLRPGLNATLSVLSIGGLAALVASARQAAQLFFDEPLPPEEWRRQLHDLLLRGVLAGPEGGTRESGDPPVA